MRPGDLSTLPGLRSPAHLKALHELGVCTIADLSAFAPARNAAFLMGLANQDALLAAPLECYLDDPAEPLEGVDIGGLPSHALRSLSKKNASVLSKAFGIGTVGELARWRLFRDAQRRVAAAALPGFHEKPSAPAELLPDPIGSTHTTARLSNYIKEPTITFANHELLYRADPDEPMPAGELLDAFYRANLQFNLGYLALIKQKWINSGTHLGEILHSLALAPGESRSVAFVDWMQRQTSRRDEDTEVSENLTSRFVQTRALNEVVRTTAQEHLEGSTEVDATTKSTSLGLTAGIGGGGSMASSAGGSVAADLVSLGLPVGASAGGSSGGLLSQAGALGGSFVHSKGTVQGVIQSETGGTREVLGELVQNISDATVQNAANVRSVMSTVVVDDEQRGRQRAQTRNVTNYNHSHALTIQYFEVLQEYFVSTMASDLTPVLYLPFRPLNFNMTLIQAYWDQLRRPVRDTNRVRFREWDQVVKDFNPANNAFNVDGELRIERIEIARAANYTGAIQVELSDANPVVKFKIPMHELRQTLDLEMIGGSSYVEYEVLDDPAVRAFSNFGSLSSIPVDESIACHIRSDFRSEFRKKLKAKIDSAPRRSGSLDFNEVGPLSNRDNLKDDIESGNYKLLNGSDHAAVDLDIEYTLIDDNDNVEIVRQQHSVKYTYSELHSEIDERIFSASEYITANLESIADINPLRVIEDIEGHFRFHKYGYTKYLLSPPCQ